MRRLTRFLIAAAATFTWFSATAPDAGAAMLTGTSPAGSAACVAVRGLGYGYCLPSR